MWCRDKTLFFAHVGISCVLGVFCGMSSSATYHSLLELKMILARIVAV